MSAPAPKHIATLGSIGGVPLVVDLYGNSIGTSGDPWAIKRVTLSANYAAVNPPGFPDRPSPGAAIKWRPGTVASGTTRYFHAHEAAALVAAGAASYA